MMKKNNIKNIKVCAWIPKEWGRLLTDMEENQIKKESPDLLLIPEGHVKWENIQKWKQLSQKLNTAFYIGAEKEDEQIGVFYNPNTEKILKYIKHTTADRIAFERDNWSPENNLPVFSFRNIRISPSICHDHYISLLTWYQNIQNSHIILNISGEAVKRKK